MFDGKRSVTVGTFHDTSPMSSEPQRRAQRVEPHRAKRAPPRRI
jgi:hypothetical protein